jgi:hypothetical protein
MLLVKLVKKNLRADVRVIVMILDQGDIPLLGFVFAFFCGKAIKK